MKQERLILRWRSIIGLVLLAGLPLLTGCVYCLPHPMMRENHGMKATKEMVRFIQIGETTHDEVVEHLGTNYVSLWRERAIAYPWETKGLSFEWYLHTVAPSGYWSEQTDPEFSPTGARWQAFFVAFDDHAVVQATCFKKLSANKSLDEQLDHWAAKQKPKK